MKFTIITVCYNAQEDIEKTIQSVLEQDYKDYEYIIKDGLSKDQTMEIVQKAVADDVRVKVESCKDEGIYDAMNQALKMAEGEYIFFLNAGDVFHDCEVLTRVNDFIEKHNADAIYGNIVLKKKDDSWIKRYGNKYRFRMPYLIGDCICHQALFAKRELFISKCFDTSYRICADREWQIYYLQRGMTFIPSQIMISDVLVDGFSMQNVKLFEKETEMCIQLHYPKMVWIYRTILRLKDIALVRRIISSRK